MKLKYEMVTMDMDGSIMAIPADSGDEFIGVLHMNGITADILELLKNDVTMEEAVTALKNEYDATDDEIRRSVQKVVNILRDYSLIIE